MKVLNTAFILCALALTSALPIAAGDVDEEEDRRRGPQRLRGAAVVSATSGDVRAQNGLTGDWETAFASMALRRKDRLATGRGSRAELELGPGNYARLGPNTEVEVGDLGTRAYRLRLIEGTIRYSLWKHGDADVDIVTGDLVVRPLKPGKYQVKSVKNSVSVEVRKGRAEVESPDGLEDVKKGSRVTIRQRDDRFEVRASASGGKDQLEDWSDRRDKILRSGGGRDYGRPYFLAGYPWHFGFGYYHRPYHRYGFGVRTVFLRGGHRGRGRGRR